MIKIKNCKIFTVNIDCKFHWSKLSKLKELLNNKYFNLSDANLSDANLSDANLSDANLSDANLSRANLSDANLSRANLSRANLSDANLSRANLSWANLSRANLSDANLSWANLSWANLSRANLSDANLSDANLSWANLSWAVLSRAYFVIDEEKYIIEDFVAINHIGSFNRQTVFLKTDKGICVHCGCFKGTLKEFKAKIKETHGDNKHAKVYKAAINLAEIRFTD